MGGLQDAVAAGSLEPYSPNHELRIARWNEFDSAGLRLPKVSLAERWWRAELWLAPISTVGFVVLYGAWLFFDVPMADVGLVCLVPATILMCASPNLVRNHFRRTLLMRFFGEENPAEPTVLVRYEVDGLEYGRDVGRISFETHWVYFEGERTSFSLGPNDFARAYKPNVLHLNHTNSHVKIRFEGLSVDDADLRRAFWDWKENAQGGQGIAVLPPLELPIRNDLGKYEAALASIRTGAFTLAAVFGLASIVSSEMHGMSNVTGFVACVLATVAGVGCRWIPFDRRRSKALARLGQIWRGIEAEQARLATSSASDVLEQEG
jgi:hypothetical protein